MPRSPVNPFLSALALSLFAVAGVAVASGDRASCVERMAHLIREPQADGSVMMGDCVRQDITAGRIDMQTVGFAVFSEDPGGNIEALIDAGFVANTGQGAVAIGTLNKMYLDRKMSGRAFLEASRPLIAAGAFALFADGRQDVLGELLRFAPDPYTVCGYAEIVGGFAIYENREYPRGLAAENPAFEDADFETLHECGL